jgi:type I restriction enzyme, S subunit
MTLRLRHVADFQRGAGFPHEQQGNGTGDLPLGAKSVPAGSVVLPKIGAALLGNARRVTSRESLFDNNVLGVVPKGIDSGYLAHWLSTIDLGRLSQPGPVPSLDDDAAKDLVVPVGAPTQQRAIANFLDAETVRIDALVEAKKQLAQRLVELRTSVTTAGVAGRFWPSQRCPTTLEWLDDIPSHWRAGKLSLAAKLGSGHTPSRGRVDWWAGCTIPWVTTGEVAEMRSDELEYVSDTRECISEAGLANSSAEVHPAGTVVLSRTASAGYSAIMARDMATSQDFVAWTCGPLLRPRFLLLCLRAMRRDLLGRLAMGSTHQTIYMPDIESIRVPLPPVEEQDQIVGEVWRRLGTLGLAAKKLNSQIELLSEHRQALITAAVTGELTIP